MSGSKRVDTKIDYILVLDQLTCTDIWVIEWQWDVGVECIDALLTLYSSCIVITVFTTAVSKHRIIHTTVCMIVTFTLCKQKEHTKLLVKSVWQTYSSDASVEDSKQGFECCMSHAGQWNPAQKFASNAVSLPALTYLPWACSVSTGRKPVICGYVKVRKQQLSFQTNIETSF